MKVSKTSLTDNLHTATQTTVADYCLAKHLLLLVEWLISVDATNPTVEVFLGSPVGFVASSPTVANYPYPTQPNPTQPNLTFGNLAVDRYQVALLHMQYYYKLSGILCRLGASVPDKKKLIVIFK